MRHDGAVGSKGIRQRKPHRPLPKVGTKSSRATNTGFGEDDRPYWQRLYGIGRPWNKRAFDNYATFALVVVGAIVFLFAVLYAAIWLTS
jgi:hypothetical protein